MLFTSSHCNRVNCTPWSGIHGVGRLGISWQNWRANINRVPPESCGVLFNIHCSLPQHWGCKIGTTLPSYLLSVSWIVYSPRCLFQDPRCLFEDPQLTNSQVLESSLHTQTLCRIKENPTRRSFSVHLQQVEALVAYSARQIPQTQLQAVDCSDQALSPLPRRQQPRSATRVPPEEVLFLAGVEPVAEVEVAATYSVEKQRSLLVDLVGALARCRAIMLLVVFLAPAKQGSKPMYPRAAPRLHLVSLASLLQANLQKHQ